jgi:hypothetical protein
MGTVHGAPHQPCIHHGCSHLSQSPDRDRWCINIAPTLEDKVDICQNAIDLAISLGLEKPKVAILAAVETVTSKMPATIDAAALCKMADRGQITGGILDGPLAFDNAISKKAARTKGIRSEVAGDPDILLAPDLEAGIFWPSSLVSANADSGFSPGVRRLNPHQPRRRRSSPHGKLCSSCVGCPRETSRKRKGELTHV